MKGFSNFFNGLTSGQKVFFVVVSLIILWIGVNMVKGAYSAANTTIRNQGEVAVLNANGIKASYTQSDYERFADDLFEAMDGSGTDSAVVFSTFGKLKNDVDFIKLEQAFGVRSGFWSWGGLVEAEDLDGWLRADLSSEEISKLNKQLQLRGITKRV